MKKIVFYGGVGAPNEFGGVLTKNKEIIARLQELGCNVNVIDVNKSSKKPLKLLKIAMIFFMNYLFNSKASFIFSTSFGNIYFLFRVLSKLPLKRNVILWVIGGNLVEYINNGKYNAEYLRFVDTFIVEGKVMQKGLIDLGMRKVLYMPNFKTIKELPPIVKYNDGCTHFVFLSRIIPSKGCRYILECVKNLNSMGLISKFVVDFYGGIANEYKEEFLLDVDNYENVHYCGSLQLLDEKNYSILAKYNYMLFPTYWLGEGFPGVVIDAYKAGVPIIASDWNFNEEFIKDGETGFLVPTHSVEDLTKVMECAILNKYDNMLMSQKCQDIVGNFDTKVLINESFLNDILI